MSNELPKEITKQQNLSNNGNKKPFFNFGYKTIIFCFICFISGGIIGIVFQPPGLKAFLRTFDIEPGSGTSSPIAVSVKKIMALENDLAQNQPGDVVGLGTIIPVSELITIAAPYGAGDAKIKQIFVQESQQVKRGDKLAELDSYPELLARMTQANNNIKVKQAILEQTINQVQANLAETRAIFAKAKAKALNEINEYERIKNLFAKKVASKSELDLQQTNKEQAEREVEQAQANLSRYDTAIIEEQVDVLVAMQDLAVAKSEYAQAQKELARAEIKSPIDATILDILSHPGEKPSSEGVFVVGNLEQMMVRVDVYQTDIAKVKIGNDVKIRAVSLNQALHGKVIQVGLQVKKQTRVGDNPAANTDARVVEVDVLLDKASSKLAASYTNMQVVAIIDVGMQE